jgi:DNA replication and repair protein RecF
MITKLSLSNFRKFQNKEFEFNKNIIVLHGENAQGKSSILEALFLISNGHSPWASTNEYVNVEQKKEPYVRIELEKDGKEYVYFKDNNKRIFKIEGSSVRPRTFFDNSAATIFNPELIELLMISSSQRRDFLDQTILKYDIEYEETLKMFKKVLRQRNAYLKKLAKLFYEKGVIARNDPQLNFWTKEFINSSVDIFLKRNNLCKQLSKGEYDIKYITKLDLDKRKISDGEYLKEVFEENLEDCKRRDIATGYTNLGPHRDDWQIHNGKDIKKFGSRGEKRLAIGKLIFQTQEIVFIKNGFYPILLLDDIASELDIKNTINIFNKQTMDKQQTFITVIDYKTLPKEILKEAQLIDLNSI